MKEYIERDAARDLMEQALVDEWEIQYADDRLDEIPAADVVEVRHGRWIDMGDFISCSFCTATRMKEFLSDYGVAKRLDARTNYCPNCGAKMDGERKGGDE